MTDIFVNWTEEFDRLETAWDADCVPLAPFCVGDQVVEIANPQSGSGIVTEVSDSGGYGRIGVTRNGCWTSDIATRYARVPCGWREPPMLLNTGDPYKPRGGGPTAEEQARRYLDIARWHDEVGRLVNPGLAGREAAGLRWLAKMLREEGNG